MAYILPLREYDPQLRKQYRYGTVTLNMSDRSLSYLMKNLVRFHGVIVSGIASDDFDWNKPVGRVKATFVIRLPEMVYQRFQDESGVALAEIDPQEFVGDRHYQCRIRMSVPRLSALVKALVRFGGALTCTYTDSYQYEVNCMIKLPKLTWHKFWQWSGIKLCQPAKISVPSLFRPIPGEAAYPKLFFRIDRKALERLPVRCYNEKSSAIMLRHDLDDGSVRKITHFGSDPELYKAVLDGELLDWVMEAEREVRCGR